MDTLVNIRGGNPGGRTKYFLNDEATALKLKKAATIPDFQVIPHDGSMKVNFSTGSYITTALPLLKAWQDIEGAYIDQEQVDGMVIRVGKIQTVLDLGDKIVKHEVKLMVEGQQVTVTLYDTTLSLMVQAGAILEPYCVRALIPYLRKEIERTSKKIKEINVKVLTIVVPKGTTRRQKKLFMDGSSFREQPSTPSSPRLRTLSSPSVPVTRVLDLSPSSNIHLDDPGLEDPGHLDDPGLGDPGHQDDPGLEYPGHQDDPGLEDLSSALALPQPTNPEGTPGLLARAANWLPVLLASPFLSSPRHSPQDKQRCVAPAPPDAPQETATTPHKEVASVQMSPQAPIKEAGPSSLTKAGPPLEVAPQLQETPHSLLTPATDLPTSPQGPPCPLQIPVPSSDQETHLHKEQTPCDDAPYPQEVLSPLFTALEEELCVTTETVACHPCSVCDEVFSDVKCLKNHIETIHACGITQNHSETSSLTKSSRPIHLTPNFGSKHLEFLRSINLDQNDQEYDTSSDENEESDQETQVGRFECDKCDLVVKRAANLLAHKEEHHSLIYSCEICDHQTNDENKLRAHIKKEHTKVKYTFRCDMCVSNFNNSVSLRAHKKESHEPIYVCQECNYQTDGKETLKIHTMNEHKYNSPPCTVCGESVGNVASLQVHILSKHCTQSDMIIKMLKDQEQRIETIQQQLNNMALKKTCVIGDLKEVKENIHSSHVTPMHDLAVLFPPPVGAPMASYAHVVQAPPQVPGPPQQQAMTLVDEVPVKKVSYITDSIGHNVMFEELEKITKAKIKRKKAYGSVRAVGQHYPDLNFSEVVPKEMKENKPEVLVIQRDSVTLTNLPNEASEEYAKQQVLLSSYNMFTTATSALASNPQLKQVVLMEAAPRYDSKELLNRYGNLMLHQAKEESTSVHKAKVTIGAHTLECEGGLRASRYGDVRKGAVDMIHLRGTSGMVAYTRSVASILASAGLTTPQEAQQVARSQKIKMRSGGQGFQTQGRRSRRGPRQQLTTFQLATQNRFAGLQGNY